MKGWRIQSVKTKLIITLTGLLAMTILGCWAMNQMFLPAYYQYSKVTALSDSFEKMNSILNKDTSFQDTAGQQQLSEESQLLMETLVANRSMSAYLFQIDNFFGNLFYDFYFPAQDSLSNIQVHNVKEKTTSYVLGIVNGIMSDDSKELIREREQYQV